AIADVVQNAGELPLTADRHLADGKVERKGRSVATTAGHFTADPDNVRRPARQIPRDVAVVLVVVWRRHEDADIAAHHLRSWIAEQTLRSAVEGLNVSVAVDHDDAVDCRFDHRPESLVAVTELVRVRGDLLFELAPLRLQGVGRLTLPPRVARREAHDHED